MYWDYLFTYVAVVDVPDDDEVTFAAARTDSLLGEFADLDALCWTPGTSADTSMAEGKEGEL